MNTTNTQHADIRIGTLVKGGPGAAGYIRQILPHGFESFSLTFWETTNGIEWEKMADEILEVLDGSGAIISSLCVFGNPLAEDEKAQATRDGFREVMQQAQKFGCDLVGGFTGRVRGKPIEQSLDRFAEIWGPLAQEAGDLGLRIAFENCDMGGTWQSGDWNIAHNPTAWQMMFEAVPNEVLGLEWEPCHQMVSLIDPMPQLREWVSRIYHVHGKDATIHWDVVRKYGVHSSMHQDVALPGTASVVPPFAYHRTPGFGDSDWTAIISDLRKGGFTGSIDIEGWHDPVYRDELEMTGQVYALNYLKQCRGGAWIPNPDGA